MRTPHKNVLGTSKKGDKPCRILMGAGVCREAEHLGLPEKRAAQNVLREREGLSKATLHENNINSSSGSIIISSSGINNTNRTKPNHFVFFLLFPLPRTSNRRPCRVSRSDWEGSWLRTRR